MSLVQDLATTAASDLGNEAIKDEAKVLAWLQAKQPHALLYAADLVVQAIPNDTFAEKMAHGTLVKFVQNLVALLQTNLPSLEKTAYDLLTKAIVTFAGA